MTFPKLACVLVLLWSTGSIAGAPTQKLIAVGDGTLQGSKLKPYSNPWMFSFVKDGVRRDQGIWSDVLRYRDVDGRHLLERVQGMTYPNGLSSVTINRFDPVTVAPVYSEQHTPDGKVVKRTFAGKHIELHLTKAPGEAEEITTTDLPTPVFDFNGGMYGTLIAAQPLALGYSGEIPAVGEFDNNPVAIPFHVVRRETIDAGFKGRVRAWVVDVSGESPMTFWISDDPPYILRLELPMSGGKAVYDIIS
jgi:hypothetical protein